MTSLVHTQGLTKRYGSLYALRDINLDIPPGKIVGLVGPNGAGKTTLLRALTGQLEYEGEIQVMDREPYRQRDQLMLETGVIHDTSVLPGWMQVADVLDLVASLHPRFDGKRCLQLLERTTIPLQQKVKNLSKGMKTQLHLALVLATESRILVLDEPTHGLDILFRKQLYSSVLEDYFDQEKSILISTHQIEEVEHILSDVIFIREGRVILQESMEALTQRYQQVVFASEKEAAIRELVTPLQESTILGRHVFLVENADHEALAELGEVSTPSVADIFVALMGGVA